MTPAEQQRLAAFLSERLGAQGSVSNLSLIHGGASRETWSFDFSGRGYILRRDPPVEMLDTERNVEFAALQTFNGTSVPTPEPIALVEDPHVLGRSFIVMRRIDGGSASRPFVADPFGPHRQAIGQRFFSILGAIAAADPALSPLAQIVDTPKDPWRRELDHWEQVIRANATEPQPIAAAAIRRLRYNQPFPPDRFAVVHGDYRNGNFLHDGNGDILAVLDWEMAHIGDPHEDLAWALDPLWSGKNGLAAGMLSFGDAIGIWERTSKRIFDPKAFAWWTLFSHVKGLAIWLSCARRFADDPQADPMLAFSGWYCRERHNKIIADRLSAATEGTLE